MFGRLVGRCLGRFVSRWVDGKVVWVGRYGSRSMSRTLFELIGRSLCG